MVKCPRSFWSLRNGFHYSPELRYAIYHANIFPTVFFQWRVLNPHLEPTNKNNPTKRGQKQLVKTFLLQRVPDIHWLLTEPTRCCCGGHFKHLCSPRLFSRGENKQQSVGEIYMFLCEKKETVRAISKAWGNEFRQRNFNKNCRKTG